eukprot:RCo032227
MIRFIQIHIILVAVLVSGVSSNQFIIRLTANRLYSTLQHEQALSNTTFQPFPLRWQQQRGLFESGVHLNFHGEPKFVVARNILKVPDDNMFVTTFVVTFLLEAHSLSVIKLDRSVVNMAVEGILTHRSHMAAGNVPLFSFWNERKLNGSWVAYPTNLNEVLQRSSPDGELAGVVHWILKALGKEKLWEKVKGALQMLTSFLKVFRIPPDSDDTGVGLALAAALKAKREEFPEAAAMFEKLGVPDYNALFGLFKKHAYRPFSPNPDASLIDPRTYYWMRGFLQKQKASRGSTNSTSLALITTWMMSTEECRHTNGTRMPFNVNNVDPTVVANAIYGITELLLGLNSSEAVTLMDSEMQGLYRDGADLLAWVLENSNTTLFSRPDLVLTYYPMLYNFYAFVARLVRALSSAKELPVGVMTDAREVLFEALAKFGTPALLNAAKQSSGPFGIEYLHWDNFLGNGDTDVSGKPLPNYEDRVFSTAVAANALYDTWTLLEGSGGRGLRWRQDTPPAVQRALSQAITFLISQTDTLEEKLQSPFFSGSVKGMEELPMFFPGNVLELLNGTRFSCDSDLGDVPDGKGIFGVRGIIPEEEYQVMLNRSCFGVPVPTEFSGYNSGAPFPYWSSPALTKAATVLALSKAAVLSESQ